MTKPGALDGKTNLLSQEAQRLSRLLNDMQGVLRSQRDILRRRGMNLPPGVLSGLQDAHIRLEKLVNTLNSQAVELDQLRALAETTALINSSLDLDEVLNGVMDTVIALTGAERGYLMLRDLETGEMEFRVARNIDKEAIEQGSFTVSRSVVNQVGETGEPVVTTNAQNDPRFANQDSIVSYALRSILCVPLKVKNKVTGVIYGDNKIRSGLFGERELEILTAFANQASVAIENARLFEQARVALAEITELKDLMDDVFTSIASGVIITDAEDRITTYNKAAGEILALAGKDPLGKTINEVLPTLAEGLSRVIESVRTENKGNTVELTLEIGDRGTRNLNLKLSPLRNDEQVTEGVAIVLDDLTDTKQHEAQLNVVRRYLPPGMVDQIQSIAQLGLGGARRHITVMYVDVRPSDTFPPDLATNNPKQLMAMLSEYFAVASGPIHKYDGVIDKYMGTEVMTLFNTQLNPHDNPSLQAVKATLEMVDEFNLLYKKHGIQDGESFYRVGIHSGIATMGNVGSLSRREFTAIGNNVNLAHRLVDLALRGEIIISDDVYQPCASWLRDPVNRVEVIDRGKVEIRGLQEPAQVYQLKRLP